MWLCLIFNFVIFQFIKFINENFLIILNFVIKVYLKNRSLIIIINLQVFNCFILIFKLFIYILKYFDNVKHVTNCEIDKRVTELSEEHFGFDKII